MRFLSSIMVIFAVICTAAASPATAGPTVSQGKIDSLLLSDDDVSSIVGLPLHRVGDVYVAPAQSGPLPERDDCRSLVESDVDVWTGEFTAFRAVRQMDTPDNYQFWNHQVIAAYPTEKVAAGTFRRGFAPDLEGRCGSQTLTDTGGAIWRIDKLSVTGDSASWMSAQLRDGQDTTWHCANETRLKGNVMFLVTECQYGNGHSLAAQMASLIASRIPS